MIDIIKTVNGERAPPPRGGAQHEGGPRPLCEERGTQLRPEAHRGHSRQCVADPAVIEAYLGTDSDVV